jgi:hypothetical protein
VLCVALGIDALSTAGGLATRAPAAALALSPGAGLAAVAPVATAPAVLRVALGIDALPAAGHLSARAAVASTLALAAGAGLVVAAAVPAAAAVGRVVLGVDAGSSAADRPVLALLLFLLLFRPEFGAIPDPEPGPKTERGEQRAEVAAVEHVPEMPRQSVELVPVHWYPPALHRFGHALTVSRRSARPRATMPSTTGVRTRRRRTAIAGATSPRPTANHPTVPGAPVHWQNHGFSEFAHIYQAASWLAPSRGRNGLRPFRPPDHARTEMGGISGHGAG